MDTLDTANKDFAEKLFKLCNTMGNDDDLADAIIKKLDKEHRTLIQCSMGVFKKVIEHYAEKHNSDLRNEASLKWAKEVAKLDNHFPFI